MFIDHTNSMMQINDILQQNMLEPLLDTKLYTKYHRSSGTTTAILLSNLLLGLSSSVSSLSHVLRCDILPRRLWFSSTTKYSQEEPRQSVLTTHQIEINHPTSCNNFCTLSQFLKFWAKDAKIAKSFHDSIFIGLYNVFIVLDLQGQGSKIY